MPRPDSAVSRERSVFRLAVFVLAFVPVSAGLAGALLGAGLPGLEASAGAVNLDSHMRYLSGLLLGIGLAFWSTVARPAIRLDRFRLLAVIVIIGGVARLLSVLLAGWPAAPHVAALAMELAVTPALLAWSMRL
ncbi:MAG: DUF4345 domain-containing protein [Phyllobacteriaceae bacterium]|jgi:hypothetical protein|nr:DUF4345 domain-containing protein [Phyllobacteriaceae bacterium]